MHKYCDIFLASGHTDVMALLLAMSDKSRTIAERKEIWRIWRTMYYSYDDIIAFFSDSLFPQDGKTYFDVIVNTPDHTNFWELAMSLDTSGLDPKAYYLFWILCYGHNQYTQLAHEAFDYDPDTIHSVFPDIEEIVFQD